MSRNLVTRRTVSGRRLRSTPRSQGDTPPIIPPAPNPVVISGVGNPGTSYPTSNMAWTVDQSSICWVEYGTTEGGSYNLSTTHETAYVLGIHNASFSGLSSSTTYYGRIVATNAASQVTYSPQLNWTTAAAVISGLPAIDGYGKYALSGLGTRTSTVTNTATFLTSFAALGSTVDIINFGSGAISIDLGSQIRQLTGRSKFFIDGRGANVTFTNGTLWFEGCYNFALSNLRNRGGWSNTSANNITISASSHDYALLNLSISGSFNHGIASQQGCYNYTLEDCLFGQGGTSVNNSGSLNYGGISGTNGPASFLRTTFISKDTKNPKLGFGDNVGPWTLDARPITYDVVNNISVNCSEGLLADYGAKVNNINPYSAGTASSAVAQNSAMIRTDYVVASWAINPQVLSASAAVEYAKTNSGCLPHDSYDTALLGNLTQSIPSSGAYPPDVTSLSYVATPSFAKPGYLVPFTDPTWGTQVMRITNSAYWRHIYSSNQVENCDGTLISMSGPVNRRILDATTYADLGSGGQPGTGRWSKTLPNRMYGTSTGSNLNCLVSRDYPSWSDTVIHRWSGETQVTMGDGEGRPSNDDRYWPIQGTSGSIYVYDRINDASLTALTVSPSLIDNSTISSLGTYLIVMYVGSGSGSTVGTWLYNRSTGAAIRQISVESNHADVALDGTGREVFIMSMGSNVRCFDLANDSLSRDLFPSGYAFGPCHVSGVSYNRPGWVCVSVYGTQIGTPGNDTVVMVKLDGSQKIEVFAHIHNVHYGRGGPLDDYRSEPQATPSRDGKKVYYASEWTDGGEVNAYVAGMVL